MCSCAWKYERRLFAETWLYVLRRFLLIGVLHSGQTPTSFKKRSKIGKNVTKERDGTYTLYFMTNLIFLNIYTVYLNIYTIYTVYMYTIGNNIYLTQVKERKGGKQKERKRERKWKREKKRERK